MEVQDKDVFFLNAKKQYEVDKIALIYREFYL